MAKAPIFRRVVREDIPDAPDWIDIIITSMNQFFDTVRLALTRNLTFRENINSQIQDFTIVAGASPTDNTYEFALTMTKKVEGLILMQIAQESTNYTPLTSVPYLNWHLESTDIVIDSILGLTSGETYNIKVLLI